MTPEAIEAWAPGARQGIPLFAVAGSEAAGDRVVMAAGATSELVRARAAIDADGILRVGITATERGTVRFVARFAVVDAVSLWRPGSKQARGSLPPSWDAPRTARALSDSPIGCLVGRHDASLVGFGVTVGPRAVQVRAGMIEESAEFLLELHVEDATETEIVLDLRGRDFAESVHDVAGVIGLHGERASVHDEQPVLCTWYSFHQGLVVDELVEDARIAAQARHRHCHHRRRLADDGCRPRLRLVR